MVRVVFFLVWFFFLFSVRVCECMCVCMHAHFIIIFNCYCLFVFFVLFFIITTSTTSSTILKFCLFWFLMEKGMESNLIFNAQSTMTVISAGGESRLCPSSKELGWLSRGTLVQICFSSPFLSKVVVSRLMKH